MSTVDTNVRLEVLDWGGSGRPIVMLAGLGDTAHAFDDFVPKLTGAYHVYGVTRRGFGRSSVPETGYSADRLGDDVLQVIDFLKLSRPILVGVSIAGEELSSVGSRHPEKVSGLIYLDAGYFYAYYNSDLREALKSLEGAPPPPPQPPASKGFSPARAIFDSPQKYTKIPVPVLAIYALPQRLGPEFGTDPATRAAAQARQFALASAQANAFEIGVPSARVVRLPNADHNVLRSNEADVLREMKMFISTLN